MSSPLHTAHHYSEKLYSLEMLDEASHKQCGLFLTSSMAGFLLKQGGRNESGNKGSVSPLCVLFRWLVKVSHKLSSDLRVCLDVL